MKQKYLIACYLFANVVANLVVGTFGQVALIATSFILIPFDLASRDVLHERWHGNSLAIRMTALIASAGALTFVLNTSALRIAIASTVSFVCAGAVDTIVYSALESKSKFIKMNGSNAFSAVVDSIIFPLIAFDGLNPRLSAGQAALKFSGGLIWSFLLSKKFLKE